MAHLLPSANGRAHFMLKYEPILTTRTLTNQNIAMGIILARVQHYADMLYNGRIVKYIAEKIVVASLPVRYFHAVNAFERGDAQLPEERSEDAIDDFCGRNTPYHIGT